MNTSITSASVPALRVDPIRFEIIRNSLISAVDEMGVALQKSAYSSNIKMRADFSCILFDRDLRAVAQAFTQPIHLGGLAKLVPIVVRHYGPENLAPGDGILSNYPFLGGVHLNDVTLISPVYHGSELLGYLANLAHHVDIGGGAPASIGVFRETYQEGLTIPVVKLVKGGVIDDDIFRFIMANVRAQHESAGDLRAQVAANKLGHLRIGELINKYGAGTLRDYFDELVDYTARRTRLEIEKLPQGTFSSEAFIDDDGVTDEPIRLCGRLTIDKSTALFDLTGTSAQRAAPMNSTLSQTFSSCAYVMRCLMDPDLPVNAGFYDAIQVVAPEGTVANAVHPAAVVGGWEVSIRWVDLFFQALSGVLPERVCAGGKSMMCHAGFGGFDPHARGKHYYCFLECLAGGYGGRFGKDGPDAVQTYSQNTENAPVEEVELNYPVRILRYELVPDSEGPGKFRGGLGLRRDYFFPDHEPTFTVLADRLKFPALGLFGGLPGGLAHYAIVGPTGEERRLGSKVTFTVPENSYVTMQTCGGGGYGPSKERDPGMVLKDVMEGKVSPERAREIYRVAIDVNQCKVDLEETTELRKNHARQ